MTDQYITIRRVTGGTDTYPVDTLEQTKVAEHALYAAGEEEATVHTVGPATIFAEADLSQIKTLEDLHAAMQAGALRRVNWSSLPNFGGAAPADTQQVWSWDATRLIVGSCGEDAAIVDREEYEQ